MACVRCVPGASGGAERSLGRLSVVAAIQLVLLVEYLTAVVGVLADEDFEVCEFVAERVCRRGGTLGAPDVPRCVPQVCPDQKRLGDTGDKGDTPSLRHPVRIGLSLSPVPSGRSWADGRRTSRQPRLDGAGRRLLPGSGHAGSLSAGPAAGWAARPGQGTGGRRGQPQATVCTPSAFHDTPTSTQFPPLPL